MYIKFYFMDNNHNVQFDASLNIEKQVIFDSPHNMTKICFQHSKQKHYFSVKPLSVSSFPLCFCYDRVTLDLLV